MFCSWWSLEWKNDDVLQGTCRTTYPSVFGIYEQLNIYVAIVLVLCQIMMESGKNWALVLLNFCTRLYLAGSCSFFTPINEHNAVKIRFQTLAHCRRVTLSLGPWNLCSVKNNSHDVPRSGLTGVVSSMSYEYCSFVGYDHNLCVLIACAGEVMLSRWRPAPTLQMQNILAVSLCVLPSSILPCTINSIVQVSYTLSALQCK